MKEVRERLVVERVEQALKPGVVTVKASGSRTRFVAIYWECLAGEAPRTGEAVAVRVVLQPDNKSTDEVVAAGAFSNGEPQ